MRAFHRWRDRFPSPGRYIDRAYIADLGRCRRDGSSGTRHGAGRLARLPSCRIDQARWSEGHRGRCAKCRRCRSACTGGRTRSGRRGTKRGAHARSETALLGPAADLAKVRVIQRRQYRSLPCRVRLALQSALRAQRARELLEAAKFVSPATLSAANARRQRQAARNAGIDLDARFEGASTDRCTA
jgi:hypothetical protein